jgi:hypothetical protein
MSKFIFLVISLLISPIVLAGDTQDERVIAADRYLKVVVMSQMLDDTVVEISKQLPAEKRPEFLRQMRLAVRAEYVERIARTSMIKHFTADELNALADFYGSKNGASVMKKFGVYMADVLPAIQSEIQRAMKQLGR